MSGASRRKLIRATIDTNLFVSGFLGSGTTPDSLLRAWAADRFALIVSQALRQEIEDVLSRPKFLRYQPDPLRIRAVLDALAAAVPAQPLPDAPVRCRDPKDEMLLSCALGGDADRRGVEPPIVRNGFVFGSA